MQITFIFAAASHIININRKKNGREDRSLPHSQINLINKRSARNNQLEQQHTISHDGNYGRVHRATTGRDARPPDSPDCGAEHSVTRFNSETFAYVSRQGEEARFIRKQLIGLVDLMKTSTTSANQRR